MRPTLLTQGTLLATAAPMALAAALGAVTPAAAEPQGARVTRGAAGVTAEGSTTVVRQQSGRAIIEWDSYDIDVDEVVRYEQPGRNSVSLNRVVGDDGPSRIDGGVQANGHVWIVNRHGVAIGETAKVDVGGLLATTVDIRDDDFMAGRDRFTIPGEPGAAVSNAGEITFGEAGLAALVGAHVENSGVIAGEVGTVLVGGRETLAVDLAGDGLFAFAFDQAGLTRPDGASASQTGAIVNPGGRVLVTAAGASALVDASVSVAGLIDVSAARGGAVEIAAPGGSVDLSGAVSARGAAGDGGAVRVKGRKIVVAERARIDASGSAAGGFAAIVGSQSLSFAGAVDVSGGAGKGGFIDTSAPVLTVAASADIDASSLYGEPGEWLIDPVNITIRNGAANNAGEIDASTIVTALEGGADVTVQSAGAGAAAPGGVDFNQPGADPGEAGDITVVNGLDSINPTNGDVTLTLDAVGDVVFQGQIAETVGGDALSVVLDVGSGRISTSQATPINIEGAFTATTAAGLTVASSQAGFEILAAGGLTLPSVFTYQSAVAVGVGDSVADLDADALVAGGVTDLTVEAESGDVSLLAALNQPTLTLTLDSAVGQVVINNGPAVTTSLAAFTARGDTAVQFNATASDIATSGDIELDGGGGNVAFADAVTLDADGEISVRSGQIGLLNDANAPTLDAEGAVRLVHTGAAALTIGADIGAAANVLEPAAFFTGADRTVSVATEAATAGIIVDDLNLAPGLGDTNLELTSALGVTFNDSNALNRLSATARGGPITQGGGAFTLRGDASFLARNQAGDRFFDVALATATNDFQGALSITGQDAAIADANDLTLGAVDLNGFVGAPADPGNDTTIDALGNATIRNFEVTVGGALGQAAQIDGVDVAVDVLFDSFIVAPAGAVTLDNSRNNFASDFAGGLDANIDAQDALRINAPGQTVTLADRDSIVLGALAADTLTVTAGDSIHDQGDAAAAIVVQQATVLTASADALVSDGAILLDFGQDADPFAGGFATANLIHDFGAAGGAAPTDAQRVDATGDVVVLADDSALRLGAVQAGSLTAQADGSITDADAPVGGRGIVVAGRSELASTASIVLDFGLDGDPFGQDGVVVDFSSDAPLHDFGAAASGPNGNPSDAQRVDAVDGGSALNGDAITLVDANDIRLGRIDATALSVQAEGGSILDATDPAGPTDLAITVAGDARLRSRDGAERDDILLDNAGAHAFGGVVELEGEDIWLEDSLASASGAFRLGHVVAVTPNGVTMLEDSTISENAGAERNSPNSLTILTRRSITDEAGATIRVADDNLSDGFGPGATLLAAVDRSVNPANSFDIALDNDGHLFIGPVFLDAEDALLRATSTEDNGRAGAAQPLELGTITTRLDDPAADATLDASLANVNNLRIEAARAIVDGDAADGDGDGSSADADGADRAITADGDASFVADRGGVFFDILLDNIGNDFDAPGHGAGPVDAAFEGAVSAEGRVIDLADRDDILLGDITAHEPAGATASTTTLRVAAGQDMAGPAGILVAQEAGTRLRIEPAGASRAGHAAITAGAVGGAFDPARMGAILLPQTANELDRVSLVGRSVYYREATGLTVFDSAATETVQAAPVDANALPGVASRAAFDVKVDGDLVLSRLRLGAPDPVAAFSTLMAQGRSVDVADLDAGDATLVSDDGDIRLNRFRLRGGDLTAQINDSTIAAGATGPDLVDGALEAARGAALRGLELGNGSIGDVFTVTGPDVLALRDVVFDQRSAPFTLSATQLLQIDRVAWDARLTLEAPEIRLGHIRAPELVATASAGDVAKIVDAQIDFDDAANAIARIALTGPLAPARDAARAVGAAANPTANAGFAHLVAAPVARFSAPSGNVYLPAALDGATHVENEIGTLSLNAPTGEAAIEDGSDIALDAVTLGGDFALRANAGGAALGAGQGVRQTGSGLSVGGDLAIVTGRVASRSAVAWPNPADGAATKTGLADILLTEGAANSFAGDVSAVGRNVLLAERTPLQVDGLRAAADAYLTAPQIALSNAVVDGALAVETGGDATLDAVRVTGLSDDHDPAAPGLLGQVDASREHGLLAQAGGNFVARDVVVETDPARMTAPGAAPDAFEVSAGGTATVERYQLGAAVVAAQGDVAFTDGRADNRGGAAQIRSAGGAVRVENHRGDTIAAAAAGDVTLDALRLTGGASALAGDSVFLGALRLGGGLTAFAGDRVASLGNGRDGSGGTAHDRALDYRIAAVTPLTLGASVGAKIVQPARVAAEARDPADDRVVEAGLLGAAALDQAPAMFTRLVDVDGHAWLRAAGGGVSIVREDAAGGGLANDLRSLTLEATGAVGGRSASTIESGADAALALRAPGDADAAAMAVAAPDGSPAPEHAVFVAAGDVAIRAEHGGIAQDAPEAGGPDNAIEVAEGAASFIAGVDAGGAGLSALRGSVVVGRTDSPGQADNEVNVFGAVSVVAREALIGGHVGLHGADARAGKPTTTQSVIADTRIGEGRNLAIRVTGDGAGQAVLRDVNAAADIGVLTQGAGLRIERLRGEADLVASARGASGARDLVAEDVVIAQDARFAAQGDASVSRVAAGGALVVAAEGDATLTDGVAATAQIAADETATARRLVAGAAAAQGGDTVLDRVRSAGDVEVAATADARLADVIAGGDIDLAATGVVSGLAGGDSAAARLQAGGALTLGGAAGAAPRTARLEDVVSGERLVLEARDRLELDRFAARAVTASAGVNPVGAAGDLALALRQGDLAGGEAAPSVSATTGNGAPMLLSDLRIGAASAGPALQTAGTGGATLERLRVAGEAALRDDGALSLGWVTVTGDLDAEAGAIASRATADALADAAPIAAAQGFVSAAATAVKAGRVGLDAPQASGGAAPARRVFEPVAAAAAPAARVAASGSGGALGAVDFDAGASGPQLVVGGEAELTAGGAIDLDAAAVAGFVTVDMARSADIAIETTRDLDLRFAPGAPLADVTLSAVSGAGADLRLHDEMTANVVRIVDFRDVAIGLKRDAGQGFDLSAGPVSADAIVRADTTRDVLHADTLFFDGVSGRIALLRQPGTDTLFELNDKYFGVNIATRLDYSASAPLSFDLFGAVGAAGRARIAGLAPVGPRSAQYRFNLCVMGDQASCSTTPAQIVRLSVDLTPPDIFEVDLTTLADVYASFGNESLWGEDAAFLEDLAPGADDDRTEEGGAGQ